MIADKTGDDDKRILPVIEVDSLVVFGKQVVSLIVLGILGVPAASLEKAVKHFISCKNACDAGVIPLVGAASVKQAVFLPILAIRDSGDVIGLRLLKDRDSYNPRRSLRSG